MVRKGFMEFPDTDSAVGCSSISTLSLRHASSRRASPARRDECFRFCPLKKLAGELANLPRLDNGVDAPHGISQERKDAAIVEGASLE